MHALRNNAGIGYIIVCVCVCSRVDYLTRICLSYTDNLEKNSVAVEIEMVSNSCTLTRNNMHYICWCDDIKRIFTCYT